MRAEEGAPRERGDRGQEGGHRQDDRQALISHVNLSCGHVKSLERGRIIGFATFIFPNTVCTTVRTLVQISMSSPIF